MKKINKILLIISIFIFTFAFKVNAAETLIEIKNKIIVTTDTTVEDIIKVLGEPKVKTISAFGGYAYTFYTDDNYSNYLYIETTAENKIISYGSVDKNYSVPKTNNNGATLVEDTNNLSGCFYTDDNDKIIGGVYYNPSVLENGDTEKILRIFKINYDNFLERYNRGVSKHGIMMFNALSRRLGLSINLQFSEMLTALMEYWRNGVSPSDYYNYEIGRDYIPVGDLAQYTLNPMLFARLINKDSNIDYNKQNIGAFYYNGWWLYAHAISKEQYEEIVDSGTNSFFNTYYINYENTENLYVLNLLDNKMSEHEKALILAQYVQDGYVLGEAPRVNDLILWSPILAENDFDKKFVQLARFAGLNCRNISGNEKETINLCKLDGQWTYIDASKVETSIYDPTPYQLLKFNVFFDSIDTIKEKGLLSKYNLDENSEPGVATKIEEYASRVYYDENYKYYEKTIGKTTKLYKENRESGIKEELANVLYNEFQSGLVKDGDVLYYVGTDRILYSLNIKSNEVKKERVDQNFDAIFVSRSLADPFGKIFGSWNDKIYTDFIDIKILDDWPRIEVYIPDDKEKEVIYAEAKNNVSILNVVEFQSFNYKNPKKDDVYIPDKINGKPVIGIESEANYTLVNNSFTAPKNLQYIGDFGIKSKDIKEINLNSKLVYIGKGVLSAGDPSMDPSISELIIPDSVKFIGDNSFGGFVNLKHLQFGSGLIYIGSEAFSRLNPDAYNRKLIIPNNVEYIGKDAFCTHTGEIEAIIFPESLLELYSSEIYPEEIFIKSKNMRYLERFYGSDIYLPSNSKTSKSADENNIEYYDINNLKQRIYLNSDYYGDLTLSHKSLKINASVKPKYYFDETKLTWESTNPNVAKVDNEGNVTLVGKGDATIKLTSSNGGIGTYDLKVIGLNLNYERYKFTSSNQTLKLEATESKDNTETYVTWESSNPDVAEVDIYGNVTAKKTGTAKIIATSSNYGTAECTISVNLPIDIGDGTKGYIGDINGNNTIEVVDAIEALKYYVEIYKPTEYVLKVADFNGNNKIDVSDAIEILNLYVSK